MLDGSDIDAHCNNPANEKSQDTSSPTEALTRKRLFSELLGQKENDEQIAGERLNEMDVDMDPKGLIEEVLPTAKRIKVYVVELSNNIDTDQSETRYILKHVLDHNPVSGETTALMQDIVECQDIICQNNIDEQHYDSFSPPPSNPLQYHASALPSPSLQPPPLPEENRNVKSSVPASGFSSSTVLALVLRSPLGAQQKQSHDKDKPNGYENVMQQSSIVADCAICHQELSFVEPGSYCVLPCHHIYHQSCIKPWFQTQVNYLNNVDCPRCRKVIPYSTTPLIEIAPNRPLSSSQSTSNTLEVPNFLVDNDLLPLPPPVQTEQEIIEDFLVRAQRPNRDLVTTLIMSRIVLIFLIALAIGIVLGFVVCILIIKVSRYFCIYRACFRLIGQSLAEMLGNRIRNHIMQKPSYSLWFKYLVKSSIAAAAFLVSYLASYMFILSHHHLSEDQLLNRIVMSNIIFILMMFIGYIPSQKLRSIYKYALQTVLTYHVLAHWNTHSWFSNLWLGCAHQTIFVTACL